MLRFVWPGLSAFLARRCAERCSAEGKRSNGQWELGSQGGVWYGARSDVIARKLVDAARVKKIVERSGGLIMIQTTAVAIDKPGMRPGEETKQDYDNAD